MAFDLSTATPVGAEGFDLATANADQPAEAKSPQAEALTEAVHGGVVNSLGDIFAAGGRAAVGGVVKAASDVAGLGAIPLKAVGLIETDPAKVQAGVQSVAPEAQTDAGKFADAVLGFLPGLVQKGFDFTAESIRDALKARGMDESTADAIGRGIAASSGLVAPAIAKVAGPKAAAGQAGVVAEQQTLKGQNALRDANLLEAKKAGFVVPPGMLRSEAPGSTLVEAGGKIKGQQKASVMNSRVGNKLAREDVGMRGNGPISPDELRGVRDKAYDDYLALVRQDYGKTKVVTQPGFTSDWETVPTVTTRKLGIQKTPEFEKTVNDLFAERNALKTEYPHIIGDNTYAGLLNDVLKPEHSITGAINIIKRLRNEATTQMKDHTNYQAMEAGRFKVGIANAMEDLIEQNLSKVGSLEYSPMTPARTELVDRFRAARTTIAKTYDIEKALNWATGDVSLQRLAALADKRPLSGGLLTAATFAKQFPKAAQDVARIGSVPAFSPWDAAFSIGAVASGHPWAAVAELGSRSVLPSVGLSQAYQNAFVKPPAYSPGMAGSLARGIVQPGALPFLAPQPEKPQGE